MTKPAIVIRQEFIDFFKNKGHQFVPSAPVIPNDDPTLLFTNAGMNQFKAIFLGENRNNLKRVVNSQKCMRVSGKHNDLEEVGVDHHHHTFFEMLGNWSFGDYYKKEAITWAWELITEIWKLPKDKLYVTVYEEDIESESIWKESTDVRHKNIGRHGAKDNFWEMGDTGPCGPCSEIHLDCGEGTCVNEHDENHVCAVNADGCGRYMEIWNLVFIQYNRGADGKLTELPNKHVDTGMGFERITRVIQGVQSNYDTDVFMPIINAVENLSGKKYDTGIDGTPFRVIADHTRALVFAITDGAFPSNEGRGYVLRRLLRRAYRFGSKLGFNSPFIYKLVPVVIDMLGEAFPEIKERRKYIEQIIESEEERFGQTLEQGLHKLDVAISNCKKNNANSISGKNVFTLYDTYGFPMDLTRLIASEEGLQIDEAGFEKEMNAQKTRAREATKANAGDDGLVPEDWIELKSIDGTKFVGFDNDEAAVNICRYKILSNVSMEYLLVLDKTPFYAEMGGQAGDKGELILQDKTVLQIYNTIKWNDMSIHRATSKTIVDPALFSKPAHAKINSKDQIQTRRNHSATHLLQAALIKILGTHITQSGSRVDPKGLRFDFTHFKALTPEEIQTVENQVNEWTLGNFKVITEIKNTDDAKKDGATALFGEKYGDTVRVVSMDNISKELCGGTHVESTGNIGLFHIISESSIASGIRRIEAVTGTGSLQLLRRKQTLLSSVMNSLKVNEDALVQRVLDTMAKVKTQESELEKIAQESAGQDVEKLIDQTQNNTGNFPWTTKNLGSIDKKKFFDIMDSVSDIIKQRKLETTAIFLAGEVGGKALFAACAGNKAMSDFAIHCGELVKVAAKIAGGGGGGNPVRAQAGGKNVSAINDAILAVETLVKEKAGL